MFIFHFIYPYFTDKTSYNIIYLGVLQKLIDNLSYYIFIDCLVNKSWIKINKRVILCKYDTRVHTNLYKRYVLCVKNMNFGEIGSWYGVLDFIQWKEKYNLPLIWKSVNI